jgi:hypothetical protein
VIEALKLGAKIEGDDSDKDSRKEQTKGKKQKMTLGEQDLVEVKAYAKNS